MFTIKQIEEANSKIRCAADLMEWMTELYQIGILRSDFYVHNGLTKYFGVDNYSIQLTEIYPPIKISDETDAAKFHKFLEQHRLGEMDYSTFLKNCAEVGIEKWTLDFAKKTRTYFDCEGEIVTVESLPTIDMFRDLYA